MMSREEAAKLEETEWKEAHERFHQKYDSDMDKMLEISAKLKDMLEPPRILKKTEGQRKRDKYAKIQARELARAKRISLLTKQK